MNEHFDATHARRGFLKTGAVLAGSLLVPDLLSAREIRIPNPSPAPVPAAARIPAAPVVSSRVVRPELLHRALAALQKHDSRITVRDRIAIADFAAPSSQPRFHFVDLASGRSTSLLVAHGSGSDPSHSGWLRRFSNDVGSNASCEGAFVASDYYVGKHGQSQRLVGLDRTNCNALPRAIVIHGAWYANKDMIATRGMLGRSQGCFAVGESDLAQVFARLGPGRMIYAAKV